MSSCKQFAFGILITLLGLLAFASISLAQISEFRFESRQSFFQDAAMAQDLGGYLLFRQYSASFNAYLDSTTLSPELALALVAAIEGGMSGAAALESDPLDAYGGGRIEMLAALAYRIRTSGDLAGLGMEDLPSLAQSHPVFAEALAYKMLGGPFLEDPQKREFLFAFLAENASLQISSFPIEESSATGFILSDLLYFFREGVLRDAEGFRNTVGQSRLSQLYSEMRSLSCELTEPVERLPALRQIILTTSPLLSRDRAVKDVVKDLRGGPCAVTHPELRMSAYRLVADGAAKEEALALLRESPDEIALRACLQAWPKTQDPEKIGTMIDAYVLAEAKGLADTNLNTAVERFLYRVLLKSPGGRFNAEARPLILVDDFLRPFHPDAVELLKLDFIFDFLIHEDFEGNSELFTLMCARIAADGTGAQKSLLAKKVDLGPLPGDIRRGLEAP
jgi:hypothetical protein